MSLLLAGALSTGPQLAIGASPLPTGAQVAGGAATVSLTDGGMNVTASTNRSIINWNSFDVAAGKTANFQLPNANAAILNRVVQPNMPSTIAGQIRSNGNVLLVNPSGVVVTQSGVVNTNGFTASAYDVVNREFMAGGDITLRPGGDGSVVNAGTIRTGTGGASLVGDSVSNLGTMESSGGSVSLSGGGVVTLSNGATYVQASADTVRHGINPTAGLINNEGTIRATGSAAAGGEVYLVNPNGDLLHDGTITATKQTSGDTTVGGKVQLEANQIAVGAGAAVDATGTHGGGEVLVGGDWQGGGSMSQAQRVSIDADATIDASATDAGDGGKIVAWSNVDDAESHTQVAGTLTARGGQNSGDGGQIETSGAHVDTAGILIDAGATQGQGGEWLIDPENYTIDATAAGNIVTALDTGTSVTVSTAVNNTSLGSIGAGSGDIVVNHSIVTGAMAGDATLTLKAHRTIRIVNGSNIDATQNGNTSKLNIVLWSDQDQTDGGMVRIGDVGNSTSLATNGGGVWIGGGSASSTAWEPFAGGTGLSVGSSHATTASGTSYWYGVEAYDTNITTAGGNFYAAGLSTRNAASSDYAYGVHFHNVALDTQAGSLTLHGQVNHTGTVQITSAAGIHLIGGTSLTTTSGDISITGELLSGSRYLRGAGVQTGTAFEQTTASGDVTIQSGSGDISIIGTVDQAVAPTWGLGVSIVNYGGDAVTIGSGDGNISISGTAIPEPTGESLGFVIQNVGGSTSSVTTDGGNISVFGDSGNGSANFGIALRAGESAGNITFGDADTGNVTLRSDSTSFYNNTATGTIQFRGTGDFLWEPNAASFAKPFTLGDEFDLGTTFQSVTLGKATNTAKVDIDTDISVAGAFTAIGGHVELDGDLTSSDTGDIYLQGNANSQNYMNIRGAIDKTGGGRSTLTMRVAGRIILDGSINASGAALDTVMWSDYNNAEHGGTSILGTINTGGGHLWAGGSSTNGGSATWNGLTVGDGPSVGQNGYNHNALDLFADVTTGGGDMLFWAGDGYSAGTDGVGIHHSPVLSSGTGAITFIADEVVGGLTINSSGHFTYQSHNAAWKDVTDRLDFDGTISSGTFTGGGDVPWLTINNYTSLGGLTLGKTGNTSEIRVYDPVNVQGPIELIGAEILVDAAATLTANGTGGNIVLDSTADVAVDGAINAGGTLDVTAATNANLAAVTAAGDVTITAGNDVGFYGVITRSGSGDTDTLVKAGRHVVLHDNASVATSGGTQNIKLWADSDDSGDGISIMRSTSLATGGGSLTTGNGNTATIGSNTVKVGGDIYISNANAQSISTGGGDMQIQGEVIVANASSGGVTFSSGGGDVTFGGAMNSGNSYDFIDGPDGSGSWDSARTDARNGTGGGAALGDSYLVTITSRLENAIAGIAANYSGAWIGAMRSSPTTNREWQWADGPEGGDVFFDQSVGGGGSARAGWYSNFGNSEPNGALGTGGETVGQFFGEEGLWNDLPNGTTYSATQAHQFAVLGYVRETNLAPTAVTVNAGTGTVSFQGGVGGGKSLASLGVTSASTSLTGNALVASGALSFSSALTATSSDILNVQGSSLTVGGDMQLEGTTLTLNTDVTSSGDDSILLRADALTLPSSIDVDTEGDLTVEPQGTSFASTLTWPGNITLTSTPGSLTLGKTGNTADISINASQTVAGDIDVHGGTITIAAAQLHANGGGLNLDGNVSLSNDTVLQGNTITVDGTIDGAHRLELAGTGPYTLNGTVGGSTPISSLEAANDVNLHANVTTSGSQDWNGNVELNANVELTGSAVQLDTVSSSGGSNLTLRTDSLTVDTSIDIAGTLLIAPQTGGTSIGVGTGTGSLTVDTATLANLDSNIQSVKIGDATAGALQVGGISQLDWDLILQAGAGADLTVNGDLAWNTADKLTLMAGDNIFVRGDISVAGNGAGLELLYGGTDGTSAPDAGDVFEIHLAGLHTIDFADSASSLKIGNETYTLIDSAGDLSGMAASGRFALANDINITGPAISTALYNGTYSGKLDGLGHVVDGLQIENSSGGDLGLFASLNGATVRQLGITSASIAINSAANTNEYRVGGLVGNVGGAGTPVATVTNIDGVWSSGSITTAAGTHQRHFFGGGLVGNQNGGTMNISRSYSSATVSTSGSMSNNLALGGLVGDIGINTNLSGHTQTTSTVVDFNISKSYAVGSIVQGTKGSYFGTGGLVGVIFTSGGTMSDSYSWGNVVGTASFGGIAGFAFTGNYSNLYTTQASVGAGSVSNSTTFTGSTLPGATNNGTQLPTGWSSDTWAVADRPTLTGLPVPQAPLYVRVTSGSSSVYGDALGVAFTVVDDGGTPVTFGAGQYANLSGTSGTGTYTIGDDTHVGTYQVSYLRGLSLTGGDADQYSLNPFSTAGSHQINPKTVTLGLNASATKVYDGSTGAPSNLNTLFSFSGLASGDTGLTLSHASAAYDSADVGTATQLTLGGLQITNVTGSSGALATDYQLSSATLTAPGAITPAAIVVSGIGANDKVYDGTTSAVANTTGVSFGGLVGGDDVSITSVAAAFGDKQVGAGKAVRLSGATYGGTDLANYTITDQTSTTAAITAKTLTISGITASNKAYDQTTTAVVDASGAVLGGLVSGDDVSLSGVTGAFANANAGTGKTVNLSGQSYSGADAGNYTIVDQTTTTADITARSLTHSGFVAGDRQYDGSDAGVVTNAGSLAGVLSGDTVTVTHSGATFADKNVGTGKTVTLQGLGLGGGQAGNYTLAQSSATDTADISPKPIVVSGITASDKVYDGTRNASVNASAATFAGLVGGDDVTVSGVVGSFSDKNVGNGKTVGLSGQSYGGADVNNYTITDQATASASISAKAVTVSGITVADKVYDRTTTGTVDVSGADFAGKIVGDDVTVSGVSGTFANHTVGTGKSVSLAGASYGGADANNYTFTDQTSTTADITRKPLIVNLGGHGTREYDGTTTIDLGGVTPSIDGVVTGDTVHIATGNVTGFLDKNVGTSKAVTFTGFGISGADAGNYDIGTGSAASTASITAKALNVSGAVVNNKVYDATNLAPVDTSSIAFGGLVVGDDVSVTVTGTFSDKHAGDGKTVTLTNVYGGADAGNYNITDQTSVTANISKRPLAVSGITAAGKTYDGNTSVVLDFSGRQLSGLVTGDDLTVATTGVFADRHAGTAKTVVLTSTHSGADVGNYTIFDQPNTSADILRLGSVTWIGGPTGDWDNPANWAGGAIPDRSNVANVLIPGGAQPSFSSDVQGPVNLDSITGGDLDIRSGTLNVSGNVAVERFSQSDGVLQVGDSLNVSHSFRQGPGGQVQVTNDVDITHTDGLLELVNLSGGNVRLDSTHGGATLGDVQASGDFRLRARGQISQPATGRLTVGGRTQLDTTGNVMLNSPLNEFHDSVDITAKNATVHDSSGDLMLGNVVVPGRFSPTSSDGAVTFDQTASGTLTRGGQELSAVSVKDTNTRYESSSQEGSGNTGGTSGMNIVRRVSDWFQRRSSGNRSQTGRLGNMKAVVRQQPATGAGTQTKEVYLRFRDNAEERELDIQ